ncbi:MAG: GNAT family N-acetyltransferase [Dehalococcoidales bacterium]
MNSRSQGSKPNPREVRIRPMVEGDITAADHIFRLAFGTLLGIPEPTAFGGDAALVSTRWRGDPAAAFVAEIDGELVASNFATNWGSLGTFGPLTVRPDLWDGGIARRLLEPTMELFTAWGTKHAGLFTVPQSAKHIGLYQKYGFYPRFLTAIMAVPVAPREPAGGQWSKVLRRARRRARRLPRRLPQPD